MSNVELVIAAEEIQRRRSRVRPAVLVNGLGLMPVWYWGNEEQKERYIGGDLGSDQRVHRRVCRQ